MEEREYCVYILSNKNLNVLYVGVTNDISRRIIEHKSKKALGFTAKYNVDRLVYYEVYDEIYEAIAREKEIKGWVRVKKNKLISKYNPQWKDLCDELY